MEPYEEHTLISKSLEEIKSKIQKKYSISSDLIEIIAEYALNLYKVVKIFRNEDISTNIVYTNDFKDNNIRVKIGDFIYNVGGDITLGNNIIALNLCQRNQSKINPGDLIPITPIYCEWPKINTIQIKISVNLSAHPKLESDVYINIKYFLNDIFELYENQVLRIDQTILLKYDKCYRCDSIGAKYKIKNPIFLDLEVQNLTITNSTLFKTRKYTQICKGLFTKNADVFLLPGTKIGLLDSE